MKKAILLSALLFALQSCSYGQTTESADELAFEDALTFYEDEEPDSVLFYLKKFLLDFPSSSLKPRAEYNIGYILREQGNNEAAIPIFKKLIESNYQEYEPFGGLMEEYALYKHRSSKHLFEIYIESGEFDMANHYLNLFDKKYKYKHFCGNEMMENKLYTAWAYSKIHRSQQHVNKAINVLLPYFFYNGLADNSYLIKELIEIIELKYSETEIKIKLQKARNSIVFNKNASVIKVLGKKLKVDDSALFALGNAKWEENINLSEKEKIYKVVDSHELFSKYLKN